MNGTTNCMMRSRATAGLLLCTALAYGLTDTARAADIEKANNGTALNLAGSYTAGGPPGTGDRIMIDSVMSTAQTGTMTANLSIAGIYVASTATKSLTIKGTNTITLGSSGIQIDAGAAGGLLFNGPTLQLGSDQTWDFGTLGATFLGSTAINEDGHALTIQSGGGSQIYFRQTAPVTLAAQISGSTAVTMDLASTLTLTNAASSYSGGTAVGASNTLSASSMRVGTGTTSAIGYGQLQLKGGTFNYTGNTSTTSQNIVFDSRFVSTLTVTTSGQTLTVSSLAQTNIANSGSTANGLILGGAGNIVLSGAVNDSTSAQRTAATLTKIGTGTLTLSVANGFTGATTISAGTLLLSGAAAINNTAGASVAAGATFTNNSSVAYNKLLTLAEGSNINGTGAFSPVSLTITADLSDGLTTFNLGSALLTKAGNLELTLTGVTDGSYSLFAGSTGGSYSTMTIGGVALTNDGSGNFSGAAGGYNYTFTNASNQLVAVAVPEPSTWALVGAGLLLVVTFRRRRADQALRH